MLDQHYFRIGKLYKIIREIHVYGDLPNRGYDLKPGELVLLIKYEEHSKFKLVNYYFKFLHNKNIVTAVLYKDEIFKLQYSMIDLSSTEYFHEVE